MLTSAILHSLETMPECVACLLEAWDRYRSRHSDHPPLERDEEWLSERWQDELSSRLRITWTITPVDVVNWWRDHGDSLPPHLQAACLQTLLEHLDDAFGEEAAECYRVGNTCLALGRRWWNARETCLPGTAPDLLEYHQPPRRLPFTNLRRIDAPQLAICRDEGLDTTRLSLFDKRLRIGLCALSGRAHTFFQGTRVLSRKNRLYGFFADDVRCSGAPPGPVCPDYLQELRDIAREARARGVNVLCLPELCICEHGRGVLREALVQGERDDMLLIVPGSFHDPLPPSPQTPSTTLHRNSGPLWTLRAGELHRITRVEKFESFQFSARPGTDQPPAVARAVEKAHGDSCHQLREDLLEASHAALIQTPVGWWGVMICRDAVYPQSRTLDALCLLADHLVVISMAEKGADFFRTFSARQVKFHLGSVYYVNAAQVLGGKEPANEIHAAWLLPSRQMIAGYKHATEYVTGFSGADSKVASIRAREENGLYVLEIDHHGLV